MKKTLSLLVFVLICFNAFSQIPEFENRVYYKKKKELLNPERLDVTLESKAKGLGYGGAETFYTVFNNKSAVRFSKDSIPTFVILLNQSIDPVDQISCSIAQVRKDRRRFTMYNMALGGKARDISESQVALEFKKLAERMYEIRLPEKIAPGEYAIINKLDSKISCFAIE